MVTALILSARPVVGSVMYFLSYLVGGFWCTLVLASDYTSAHPNSRVPSSEQLLHQAPPRVPPHQLPQTIAQALTQVQPERTSVCSSPDQQTLTAIVPVATDHGSHASGVVIDSNRVLTAAHALQGGGHFFVRLGDIYRSAELVMVDHTRDLAVLAVNTHDIQPLQVASISPAYSGLVWAVGYPRAQEMSASTGVFQQHRGDTLHTSASIDPGQSGGGLLSCSVDGWQLIGMLRGYGAYLQGDHYVKLQNHSVAVAGSTIGNFLNHY